MKSYYPLTLSRLNLHISVTSFTKTQSYLNNLILLFCTYSDCSMFQRFDKGILIVNILFHSFPWKTESTKHELGQLLIVSKYITLSGLNSSINLHFNLIIRIKNDLQGHLDFQKSRPGCNVSKSRHLSIQKIHKING